MTAIGIDEVVSADSVQLSTTVHEIPRRPVATLSFSMASIISSATTQAIITTTTTEKHNTLAGKAQPMGRLAQ